jgi:spore maturation protein CgeB
MKPLRIFYAAPNSPNSQIQSYMWRRNLRDSLAAAGHEIIDFDFDLDGAFKYLDPQNPEHSAFIENNRPRLGDSLLEQIRHSRNQGPVDLLFSYFYAACIEPSVIAEIRKLGVVTLNWYCNAAHQFHLVSAIAPAFDACLVAEKASLDAYRKIGARPIYCQEAANPAVYKPSESKEIFDTGFIGQAYNERPAMVCWLRQEGIDVRVWGSRWEHYRSRRPSLSPLKWFKSQPGIRFPANIIGGVLTDEEMVQTFGKTKVNLGFSACETDSESGKRITQIRLRDFEIPMSGAFYLTEYMQELEEFFEIDKEIVCYRSKEELRDQIRFFLRNPEQRRKIREAGRKRCLAEHTWEKRFEMVFRQLGLGNLGSSRA